MISTTAFSIQSISKVFSLALAMEEQGPEKVFREDRQLSRRDGLQFPGGRGRHADAYRQSLGERGRDRHRQPDLRNDAEEKWNKILDFYSKAAGEKLTLIDEVYKSEAATNTGNRALADLLPKYERIYADPFESVDMYTKAVLGGRQCPQLARMGATLANNGVNPATGEQVIKRENIPEFSCHDDGRAL